MDSIRSTLAGVAISAFLLVGIARADSQDEVTEAGPLTPFTSQREMKGTLKALIQQAENCSALQEVVSYVSRTRPVLSPARLDGPREAVQEGGIVKRYGDYLVVLHRNRLFTIAIGGNSLRPVAAVSALSVDDTFSPSAYDELLLVGNRIVLTGWSTYGLEIATFGIDRAGRLTRAGTWHLHAVSDCFSRSYAPFVIDGKLVVYSWHYLDETDDVDALLPALRKWPDTEPDDEDEEPPFAPTAGPLDVFHKRLAGGREEGATLHTVTVCEIPGGSLKCTSSALLGRGVDEFHVAENALYLWSAGPSGGDEVLGGKAPRGVLYRMAFDGSVPGRVPVSGRPRDRFSFRSDRTHLAVLLTSTQQREDNEPQSMALLRLPMSEIARGGKLASSRYIALPSIRGGVDANRFVGDHAIYSSTPFVEDYSAQVSHVVFADVQDGRAREVGVPGLITSIEAAGIDALAGGVPAGEKGGLRITRLSASSQAGSTVHFDFPQGDSVGLQPLHHDSVPSVGVGVIAMPVRAPEASERKYLQENVSVAFLANEATALRPMGSIASREQDVTDDVCDGSICRGWFDNARALFIGDRILVLLGYELIEAKRSEGQIVETARTHFAPPEIFWPERARDALP